MRVEWYTIHDARSQSTLDKDSPVQTLGEKSSKHWSLTEWLCKVAHTCPVNRRDRKCQVDEQRKTVLKISAHCYRDILASS